MGEGNGLGWNSPERHSASYGFRPSWIPTFKYARKHEGGEEQRAGLNRFLTLLTSLPGKKLHLYTTAGAQKGKERARGSSIRKNAVPD